MEFQDWVASLPPFTKYYMAAVLGFAIVVTFGIISPLHILFTFELAFAKFQIWRIITTFLFVSKLGFPFVFRLVFIYFGFSKLERLYIPNKMADFFWLLITVGLLNMGISWIFDEHYFLSRQFTFSVLYIWCKKEPFERVSFMFGLTVKSAYLPWAIIAYTLLVGDLPYQELIGVAAGHAFIFLKELLPSNPSYKMDILRTPKFFERIVSKYYPALPNNNFGGVNPGQQLEQAGGFRAFGGRGVRFN